MQECPGCGQTAPLREVDQPKGNRLGREVVADHPLEGLLVNRSGLSFVVFRVPSVSVRILFRPGFASAKGPELRASIGRDKFCKSLAVVPGQEAFGMGRDFFGMAHQLGQIVEWVHLVQFAGVDQAHVHVADASPVLCFEEQGILAVEDGFFDARSHTLLSRGAPAFRRNSVSLSQCFFR